MHLEFRNQKVNKPCHFYRVFLFFLFLSFVNKSAFSNIECLSSFQKLGSFFNVDKSIEFSVYSEHATHMEVYLYGSAENSSPLGHYPLTKIEGTNIWHAFSSVHDLTKMGLMNATWDKPIYYGYRVWGPNFTHEPNWVPGSLIGFQSDGDQHGNRFNPNKLLIDPYSLELSHDSRTPRNPTDEAYASGFGFRQIDSGPVAPKSIVMPANIRSNISGPIFPKKDGIIYESHVRGLTMSDPSVPLEERGTFKGAIRKIGYLKSLGINTIEFLPIQAFQNEANRQDTTEGNNYWGYMTTSFFAPNRRYATAESQRRLGGVTEEFRDMVDAFHSAGIKVIIDVVYNHTGESGVSGEQGEIAQLHSFRGIDNQTYYQVAENPRFYKDNTGCGANFNCAHPHVRDLIINSLKYYRQLGVDGFRFDLASVLMNGALRGNDFWWNPTDPGNVFNRAMKELPVRPDEGGEGVDFYAEPWAVGDHDKTYQLAGFPNHAEEKRTVATWNGHFRDTIRRTMNAHGFHNPTMGELASVLSGSPHLYNNRGRGSDASLNFVVAHDGFSLIDQFSFNQKQNNQPAPFGPSDGGEDSNHSWDQASPGDSLEQVKAKQRQAARNAIAFLMLSQGAPMITAGDEFLRSQNGNNNAYNVDTHGNWINWDNLVQHKDHYEFTRLMIAFRSSSPSLTHPHFYGDKEMSWYKSDGHYADATSMNDSQNTFLACRIDAEKREGQVIRSIYYAVNMGPSEIDIRIPPAMEGRQWYWMGDTHAAHEPYGNFVVQGTEAPLIWKRGISTADYKIGVRSILVLVEK